jgi:predicted transposase YbfD/YdcC
MGTQKEIAEQIIEQGADYVLSLKENQKTLYDDIDLYMETEILQKAKTEEAKKEMEKEGKYYRTMDNEHVRYEEREYYICNDVDWLWQKDDWRGLSGFGVCISTVTTEHRVAVETENGKLYQVEERTAVSKNYAIYSVADMTAKRFAAYKRGHWGIENTLHWELDVAFREDESRARMDCSAENLNIIRHLSYNLLKSETTAKAGMATKRLMCSWNDNYLLKVLSLANIGN